MELLHTFIDIFLHLDKHLAAVVQDYGAWTYLILFAIVFCETGLVVTPFLPGDSLLFTAGAIAAVSDLRTGFLFLLLTGAAILGDTVNYWIGKFLGNKMTFIKKEHLDRTHKFFEKYGGKTIVIARFVPMVRTFAPFVAGLGAMTYWKFITYNVVGGIAWVAVCVYAGFFFGNIQFVKDHFSLVILAIIFISILPGVIEILRHRSERKAQADPSSA